MVVLCWLDGGEPSPVGPVGFRVRVRRGSRPVRVWAVRWWGRGWVRHVVATIDRFNDRMGTQFADSLTYFSFLAVVPILMVAFSVVGFVLAWHPKTILTLRGDIAAQLPAGLSSTVTGVLDRRWRPG